MPRIHDYTFKIPGHRRRHSHDTVHNAVRRPLDTRIFASLFYFRSLSSGGSSERPAIKHTPGGQEALAYEGILRWSLITIVIPILHTRIPPAPGQDVSNSPILLIALLVYVRFDVSFE